MTQTPPLEGETLYTRQFFQIFAAVILFMTGHSLQFHFGQYIGYLGHGVDTLGQILSSNPGATLDFGIVDGGHDMNTARSDLLVMETLLKPGGYLWLDDFESNKDRCVQVSIVGREFATSRRHCLRFVTADHRGLMIYQKGF